MKRSKKRWDWTSKNKRKTRNTRYRGGNTPPNSFVKWYTRSDRMKTKAAIITELKGGTGDFPLRSHRHSAGWDYW